MPASRPDLALVPRPTKVSSLGGRLTLDRDTAVRALPGAEPAADLLRSLVGRAAGLPSPRRRTAGSSSPWTTGSAASARRGTG